jgi:hypothetical protein
LSREIFRNGEIFEENTPSKNVMGLFPGPPPSEVFLGISKIPGHLEILKEKGSVRVKAFPLSPIGRGRGLHRRTMLRYTIKI